MQDFDASCYFTYFELHGNFVQGIITAPLLFAMEEFPQLRTVVEHGFDNPENVNIVSYFKVPMQHI